MIQVERARRGPEPVQRTTARRWLTCLLLAVGGLALLAALFQSTSGDSQAQSSGTSWSKPVLLYKTTDQILYPTIVADQEGGIHVFWRQQSQTSDPTQASQQMVYYTREVDGKWSVPTDVIASPVIAAPAAAIDRFGTLHLFWHGVENAEYTATAPVDRATVAGAWTAPTFVAYDNTDAQVVADASGRLNLVYPAPGAAGVVYQSSDDGGITWSFPVTVAPTMGPNASAEFVRLAVGPDGTIHVVWTEYELPNGWPPSGVYYAHSKDGGQTWSAPTQIAGTGFDQANVAAGPKGLVHVAWNGMSGVHWRYDRWSSDGGTKWSSAVILQTPGVGGSEGPPQLDVDNSGTFHLLTSDGNRVWYALWKDGRWSNPQYVPSGDEKGIPPVDVPVNVNLRHIEQPVMALSHGDQLNVVFWDVRKSQNQTYLWYTMKKLASPITATTAFSTPLVEATVASIAPTSVPTATISRSSNPALAPAPASTPIDARWAIVPGFVAAVLVVGGVVFGALRFIRER